MYCRHNLTENIKENIYHNLAKQQLYVKLLRAIMSMLRLLLKTVDETRFVKSYHKLKYRFTSIYSQQLSGGEIG